MAALETRNGATCSGKSEEERVAIFMCMIGKDGQEVKDTFEFEREEDGKDIVTTKILFEKFEAYCKPRRNLVVDRHRFLTRDQQPGESIEQFVTELRTLAASCAWGELKDDLILYAAELLAESLRTPFARVFCDQRPILRCRKQSIYAA